MLESYKAIKLGGRDARKILSLQACQLPGLPAFSLDPLAFNLELCVYIVTVVGILIL
jgi:hypothetical protein